MGGTILRDTDRYTLKGNGQINKQETGFLQKPRKYHRLTFLQILKSILQYIQVCKKYGILIKITRKFI